MKTSMQKSHMYAFILIFLSHSCLGHIALATDNQSYNDDLWMTSASLNKVITSWIAWHTLGPNHTYKTELKYCGHEHYHINMTYDTNFQLTELKKLLSKIPSHHPHLSIQPVSLTEPYHPQWMIEDSHSDYTQQLSPWLVNDQSIAISLEQIKSLNPKIESSIISDQPSGCHTIAYHRSIPLRQSMDQALLFSNNTTMDAIWLSVADYLEENGSTTWENARATIGRWLQDQTNLSDGFVMHDGSGLSRRNQTTARGFLNILHKIEEEPAFFQWLKSHLPYAKIKGTLKNRFSSSTSYPIIAKTGNMSGVRNLAGWVITPSQSRAFVLMESNPQQYISDDEVLTWISAKLVNGH